MLKKEHWCNTSQQCLTTWELIRQLCIQGSAASTAWKIKLILTMNIEQKMNNWCRSDLIQTRFREKNKKHEHFAVFFITLASFRNTLISSCDFRSQVPSSVRELLCFQTAFLPNKCYADAATQAQNGWTCFDKSRQLFALCIERRA